MHDGRTAYVLLDTAKVHDWASLHKVCAEAFGFPEFYGRNMNAWMDCLTYLHEGDGMSRFTLEAGEHLFVLLPDFEIFAARVPEIAEALLSCTAFVNQRYLEQKEMPCLALVLQ
ncbi:barnase inhibitor [Deinococcus aetherius]|uniref:Barnase inhibitor n=1 Tax=Deinococcus aetherius TaxID=200252 RepID=A0ABN6RGG9_9DEIO|nr:barstar family protein [Deinococcus aetherius]BDP42433.1 barnase inhibitor [Deinococcus aetherius]